MSSTNRSDKRKEHKSDFYITPPAAVIDFLDACPRLGKEKAHDDFLWLEPGAGDGSIIHTCRTYWAAKITQPLWLAVELQQEMKFALKGCADGVQCPKDYLTYIPDIGLEPSVIFGNPPYSLAREFIEHSQSIVSKQGDIAMLLRVGFCESQERFDFWSSFKVKPDMYILHKRPSFTNGGTDSCCYAWLHWFPGMSSKWTVI